MIAFKTCLIATMIASIMIAFVAAQSVQTENPKTWSELVRDLSCEYLGISCPISPSNTLSSNMTCAAEKVIPCNLSCPQVSCDSMSFTLDLSSDNQSLICKDFIHLYEGKVIELEMMQTKTEADNKVLNATNENLRSEIEECRDSDKANTEYIENLNATVNSLTITLSSTIEQLNETNTIIRIVTDQLIESEKTKSLALDEVDEVKSINSKLMAELNELRNQKEELLRTLQKRDRGLAIEFGIAMIASFALLYYVHKDKMASIRSNLDIQMADTSKSSNELPIQGSDVTVKVINGDETLMETKVKPIPVDHEMDKLIQSSMALEIKDDLPKPTKAQLPKTSLADEPKAEEAKEKVYPSLGIPEKVMYKFFCGEKWYKDMKKMKKLAKKEESQKKMAEAKVDGA